MRFLFIPLRRSDIMMDIKEKNCNSYTFHKMNGSAGGQSKAVVLSPETTGINPTSPLLYGFRLSEFLTEDSYTSSDNVSIPMPPKRRYAYSVY